MRVTDSAGFTDPGRKRRRNEDSFVIDPPLFAVADGMGGAQAGEVASRILRPRMARRRTTQRTSQTPMAKMTYRATSTTVESSQFDAPAIIQLGIEEPPLLWRDRALAGRAASRRSRKRLVLFEFGDGFSESARVRRVH